MKKNKFQLIRIGLLGTALAAVIVTNNFLPKTAYAVGDLTIDWGTLVDGDPIFVVNNMAPGDCATRTVNVLNSSIVNREVGVRGEPSDDLDSLSSVLEIVIDKEGSEVYGQGSPTGVKTLGQFFTESAGPNAISLSNQVPTESFDYNFTVCFQETAGNEFQNTSVVFDLTIGIVITTPDECLEMTFANTIFGTDGNDRLRGTSAPELIFGLEGNDRIDGGGGDDCIVGGDGNDKLDGGSGADVLIGGGGNDDLDGGSNKDKLFGDDGNDKLEGGSDNDLLEGGIGEDKLDGGSGNDELHGGDQNDKLEGGSGQDQLFGESGNDNLKGGSSNDFLDGGVGGGTLNGDSGTDRCINGAPKIKCEILI